MTFGWWVGWEGGGGRQGREDEVKKGEARNFSLQVLADIWLVGWEMVVGGRTQENLNF